MVWDTPPAGFQFVLLERVNIERNEKRFYYLAWLPTLFGMAVVRVYGRRGRWQRVMTRPFDTLEAAWPTIRKHIKTRLRNGYRVVQPDEYVR